MAESRSIFQFKGFQLEHGNPGLKIGTEACIFGAYLQQWAEGNMLEIGTGSGVLTAMVAQFHPEKSIDTIEISQEVADLARYNFDNLPFEHHIHLHSTDFKNFHSANSYDFIFSNPPFFVNHLANTSKTKHTAMHSDGLLPHELMSHLMHFVHIKTKIALIYPPAIIKNILEDRLEKIFFVEKRIQIIPKEGGKVLREIVLLNQEEKSESFFSLIVKNKNNEYTQEFKDLLRPYYLIFP
ncbi:MAG: tRNA(1)(Val) ((37)-N(6))-methyltransferase [Bacteroidota bacterium]|jgi:tRNA1Val (adenine37-N6)-methyltransferase